MFRDTITRTIPVAMIAIPAPCTDSVTMLVGRMKVPPLRTLNVSRITARATSMPNSRTSISVWAISRRIEVPAPDRC